VIGLVATKVYSAIGGTLSGTITLIDRVTHPAVITVVEWHRLLPIMNREVHYAG